MWFAIFSILFYLISVLMIAPLLTSVENTQHSPKKTPLFFTALFAIALHVITLCPSLKELAEEHTFTLMN